jgi:chromosome partitioning protein
MKGTVISFLNQKGGCGKTTASINLAAMLDSMGYTVELVNMDPQGTALDWAATRANVSGEEESFFRVSSMGTNISREIGAVKRGCDFVVVDGAPQVQALTVQAIKSADIVVIPVQPTQADVWATDTIVDIIKEIHEIRDAKRPETYFMVSQVLKTSKESGTFAGMIQKGYELPTLKSRTTRRLDYQRIFEGGGSVVDLDEQNQARHEIKMLAKELIAISEGLK